MKEPILNFTCKYPVILTGRGKGRLCTNNSVPDWYRYQKTKIKDMFKQSIGEWSIPKSELLLPLGSIKFTIIRPDHTRIDADSPAISAGKWSADFLVEQGWFSDDDKIQFLYCPMVVDKSIEETMVKVEVYDHHLI